MDIRDPSWQFIGVMVALIGILIAILIAINITLAIIIFIIALPLLSLFWYRLRKFKQIAYRVMSDTSVLSITQGPEVEGRVQILLDNKPVRDVRIIVLKVWNSGTETIRLEDYYKNNPININFGNHAEILETDVLDTVPNSITKEISDSLRLEGGSIIIPSIVLERNNSITLKVMITKFKNAREINLSETRILETSVIDWDQTIQARLEKELEGKNGSLSFFESLQEMVRAMFVYWTIVLLFLLQFAMLIWFGVILFNPSNPNSTFIPSKNVFADIGINITQSDSTTIIVIITIILAVIAIILTRVFYNLLRRAKFVRRSRVLNSFFNPVKKVKTKDKI